MVKIFNFLHAEVVVCSQYSRFLGGGGVFCCVFTLNKSWFPKPKSNPIVARSLENETSRHVIRRGSRNSRHFGGILLSFPFLAILPSDFPYPRFHCGILLNTAKLGSFLGYVGFNGSGCFSNENSGVGTFQGYLLSLLIYGWRHTLRILSSGVVFNHALWLALRRVLWVGGPKLPPATSLNFLCFLLKFLTIPFLSFRYFLLKNCVSPKKFFAKVRFCPPCWVGLTIQSVSGGFHWTTGLLALVVLVLHSIPCPCFLAFLPYRDSFFPPSGQDTRGLKGG